MFSSQHRLVWPTSWCNYLKATFRWCLLKSSFKILVCQLDGTDEPQWQHSHLCEHLSCVSYEKIQNLNETAKDTFSDIFFFMAVILNIYQECEILKVVVNLWSFLKVYKKNFRGGKIDPVIVWLFYFMLLNWLGPLTYNIYCAMSPVYKSVKRHSSPLVPWWNGH